MGSKTVSDFLLRKQTWPKKLAMPLLPQLCISVVENSNEQKRKRTRNVFTAIVSVPHVLPNIDLGIEQRSNQSRKSESFSLDICSESRF